MDTRAPIKKYVDHGLVLKAARIKAQLTQRDVSKITGIPLGTLKEYEQGRYLPSVARELQLMDLLGLEVLDLDHVSLMRHRITWQTGS
jgi:transcriptional regulator with XRE-family HTH domain